MRIETKGLLKDETSVIAIVLRAMVLVLLAIVLVAGLIGIALYLVVHGTSFS